jgi:hypothetical protein
MDIRSPRWVALLVVSGLVAVLAGCTGDRPPTELDGDLTDEWGGFADPVGFVPSAQVCHPDPFTTTAPLAGYRPVDCAEPHVVETVHVGRFGESASERDTPPAPDSAAHRRAYRECEDRAEDYLGAGFRQGRLWLGVAVPPEPGWEGGARWFRCDVMEVESVYGEPVQREGSLAGKLADDPALRLGCYTVEVADGAVERMSPVGCDQPHQAEFVGAWPAPGGDYPDPADDDAEAEVYAGCRERVAEFVSLPADGDLVYRTGTIADWMSRQDWEAGDRAFRCYLWLPDEELTESLRDAGAEALPVQTG